LTAFLMCLSMFTVIPCRVRRWDDALKPLMTAMLPVVGLVTGGVWLLAARIACAVLPRLLAAIVVTAVPYLITGYMHLDGFMDTVDAVRSWRGLEERRAILKDVHCGAFAVVSLALLLLGMFAASAELIGRDMRMLLLIPVIARAMSAIAVSVLRPLGHSQYAATDSGRYVAACAAVLAALACVAAAVWIGLDALIVAAAVMVAYWAAMARAFRSLKGVSGDLAGYALSLAEFAGVAVMACIH